MIYRCIYVLFILAVTVAPLAAETPVPFLGLNEAIQSALKHHPSLQREEKVILAAEAKMRQSQSDFLPQVDAAVVGTAGSIRINAFMNPGGSLIKTNSLDFVSGLTLRQRLFDFGQTAHRVGANRSATEALRHRRLSQRALVILNVRHSYLNSLKQHRLVEIAEGTIKERQVVVRQLTALYEQQLKSKLDLDFVYVELSNAELVLIRTQNDLRASFAILNNAMGIQGEPTYLLENIKSVIMPQRPLKELIKAGLAQRSELQELDARLRSMSEHVKAARSSNLPTVNAMGSVGYRSASSDQERTDGFWSAGAGVSVPLFTGFLIENQVKEAMANYHQVEASRRDLAQQISLEVTQIYFDVGTYQKQIAVAEELVNRTKETLELATKRYQLGLGSIVEVTQAEVAIADARTTRAEARYNYLLSLATMDYAIGVENPG